MCCYGDFPAQDPRFHPCAHFSSTRGKGLSLPLPSVPKEDSQPEGGSPFPGCQTGHVVELSGPQQKNHPPVWLDASITQVWILALQRNWLEFQQESSVLGWQALDLIKCLLPFPKLHSLSICRILLMTPTCIWKGFQDLEGHPLCSGAHELIPWLTNHEINALATLHFMASSRDRLGSSNHRWCKWGKCSPKWVSESIEVSLCWATWSLSVVASSSATSCLWLVHFKLQCDRWWWCPNGICRWPYSRTDDGDSLLDEKCFVTFIGR